MKAALAIAAAVAVSAGLSACATTAPTQAAAPALDLKRVDQARYQADLAECRTIADQAMGVERREQTSRSQSLRSGAVRAAQAGVQTVAKVGVNPVAALPQLAGALSGQAGPADEARGRAIVSNCLKGRGYRVLE